MFASTAHTFAKRLKQVLCVVLCLVLVFGLQGCKYTDVLTQHVEDEVIGTLDETIEPKYKDTPGAPPDPTRTSSVIDDSTRIDDQTQTLPDYEEEQPEEQETEQREQQEDSAHDQNATSGNTENTDAEGKNANVNTGETSTPDNTGAGDGEGTGESDDPEKKAADDSPLGGDEATGGGGGEAQVWDSTGAVTELPENVGQIAAVGQYATIVQMLAGKGGLAATDEEWKADMLARVDQGMFSAEGDEGIADVPTVWTGSHEAGFTLDLQALLDIAPDAVIMDNADVVLSEQEQAALTEKGINVIVAPNLGTTSTTDEAITAAVNLVGELLKNSTEVQFSTQEMANNYVQYRTDTFDNMLKANGGYSYKSGPSSNQCIYQCTDGTGVGQATTNLSSNRITTAYIDGWTYAVSGTSTAKRTYGNASLYLDGETIIAQGAGISATTSGRSFILMDYYLQMAGVVNNAYEAILPRVADTGSSRAYLVVPGDTSQLVSAAIFATRDMPSALWYAPSSSDLSMWSTVGDADFPLILVRSSDLAVNVVENALLTNGLYNVGQPYEVRVVPTGVCGSWADGTVESFLLSPWTLCNFFSNLDSSISASYVNEFYKAFYRCPEGTGVSFVQDFDTAYTAECPRVEE
ncbi:MAG: hypothetical protein Q4E12_05690 [Coriobacteriia bacterium]|nr:hypothetical protein [Coriobacteriia bacterium]